MSDGTPYETSQDVAPPVVGGDNAVGNKECRAPSVFGDDTHRLPHFVILLDVVTRYLLDFAYERQEEIGAIDVVHVL